MKVAFKVGEPVSILEDVFETLPNGTEFLHGRRGEVGTVIHTETGFHPTIQFSNGSIADCEPGIQIANIRLLKRWLRIARKSAALREGRSE